MAAGWGIHWSVTESPVTRMRTTPLFPKAIGVGGRVVLDVVVGERIDVISRVGADGDVPVGGPV